MFAYLVAPFRSLLSQWKPAYPVADMPRSDNHSVCQIDSFLADTLLADNGIDTISKSAVCKTATVYCNRQSL